MTNRILDEYLARVREELVDLPPADREAVVDDMRGHLELAISERLAADPSADLDAITLEETRAFGDPAEIAAARGTTTAPKGARSRRRVPRWAWALLGVVLLAVAAIAIADAIDRASAPDILSLYSRSNGYSNQTGSINETFLVPLNADEMLLDVSTRHAGGCLGVRITDPEGAVVLDDWDSCSSMSHSLSFQPKLDGRDGQWRVEVRLRDFSGLLGISAYVTIHD